MRKALLTIAFLALATFGCAGIELAPTSPPAVTQAPVLGEAVVESIEILILMSFPVQVNVVARGNFPDGCTTIDQIVRERDGNTFLATITTIRPANQMCTDALVPFEKVISLDVYGLPAGVYAVTVNGVSDTFELMADNVLQTEGPSLGAIGGLVWHDLCAPPWGEAPPSPPEGCVESSGGGYEANGILELGEPGIPGVLIVLGVGDCPSTDLDTAITDGDGSYVFAELGAGTYCVSIDPLDGTNESILIPGGWTYPALDVGSATVTLAEGAEELDVDFGWDYQFLP
jgi:inhibitor of cysteine peptidase